MNVNGPRFSGFYQLTSRAPGTLPAREIYNKFLNEPSPEGEAYRRVIETRIKNKETLESLLGPPSKAIPSTIFTMHQGKVLAISNQDAVDFAFFAKKHGKKLENPPVFPNQSGYSNDDDEIMAAFLKSKKVDPNTVPTFDISVWQKDTDIARNVGVGKRMEMWEWGEME